MSSLFDFQNRDYKYIIGVDLGTTNSAVAYVDLSTTRRAINFFRIPQLVAAGEIAERDIQPSFLYLPGAYDLPEGSTELPWDKKRAYMVGEFAREQGANVPSRLVASAKSWLCHAGVNRKAPILPWGAPEEISKVSPLEASKRYLQHIKESWNHMMAKGREDFSFEEQLVVLTVPASFDEVARELTVTAAQEAGIPRVVLLEEPLAAFYAWLSANESTWQEQMQVGQLILVCDVGGGTTDLSLVGIFEGEKGLRFNRMAVGEHLMLGGDNMDLALGRYLEQKLMGQPGQLDNQRWHQLVYQCRKAKETLLGNSNLAAMDITVMGSAGKLIANTLKGNFTQEDIQKIILEGFFPKSALGENPDNSPRSGLTDLGLPYVQDAAVTRHLSAFWRRFEKLMLDETGRSSVFPDFVLFNGGVLSPELIRNHIRGVVGDWFAPLAGDGWTPAELDNPRPDLSVAIGAAYYGKVRVGEGVRVGSGSPRAYYLNLDATAGKEKELCLLPRGAEEGADIQLSSHNFEVLTNQPVAFNLATSSTRLGDKLGDVVKLESEERTALPAIQTVLRYGKKNEARSLPVEVAVRLTEIGTLELWCQSNESDHRWQLQFDVRLEADAASTSKGETIDAALVEEANAAIENTFTSSENALKPSKLMNELEETLDMQKNKWPTSLIRKMADSLLGMPEARDLSFAHESRWLNLLGYSMRPGFGDPVDDWRIKQSWKLFLQGLRNPKQPQVVSQWWIFWRRIAGGLSEGRQSQIYQMYAPLVHTGKTAKKKSEFGKLNPQQELEVWMLLANLEHLPKNAKQELGRILLKRIAKGNAKPQEYWALGRFGARIPFYGHIDNALSGAEVASWCESLMKSNPQLSNNTAMTFVHLARKTGDHTRDLSGEVFEKVENWLAQSDKQRYVELLNNPSAALEQDERNQQFGESLPSGLILQSSQ
ncbi:MAG: Hsp70 family protein [Calditrichia bacterium]